MEKYNETYSCRNRKYTINIPHQLFNELTVKAKEIDEEMPLAVYIRTIFRREVGKEDNEKKGIRIPATDKRISDITEPIWKINIKDFLDKAKSRQIYFW